MGVQGIYIVIVAILLISLFLSYTIFRTRYQHCLELFLVLFFFARKKITRLIILRLVFRYCILFYMSFSLEVIHEFYNPWSNFHSTPCQIGD
jgi:hypothetical protein